MLHASNALLPPTLSERFEIGAPIGVGGQATVLRGRHRDGRPCAIKIFRDRLDAPDDRRRFEAECRSLSALATVPGVVSVHESGVIDGTAFIVMDLFELSLGDRIASLGRLGGDESVDVLTSLAVTLAGVHAAGVVHGDIKPSNVFLDDGGGVVLGDFGTSRGALDRTITGSLAMSVAFAAPELIEAGTASESTDVYALGVTAYQMLSGELPFVDGSTGSTPSAGLGAYLRRIAQEAPTALDAENLPLGLSDLVVEMMAKSPVARPGSAARVATRLRSIAAGSPIGGSVREPGARAVGRSRTRRSVVAVSGALIAAAVIVVSLVGERRRSDVSGAVAEVAVLSDADDGELFVERAEDVSAATVVESTSPSRSGATPSASASFQDAEADAVPDLSDVARSVGSPSETSPASEPAAPAQPDEGNTPESTVSPGETAAVGEPVADAVDSPPPVVESTTTSPETATPATPAAPTTNAPSEASGPCGVTGVVVCEAFETGLDGWTLRTEGTEAGIATASGAAFAGSTGLVLSPGDMPAQGSAFIRRPAVVPDDATEASMVFRIRFASTGTGDWFTNVASMVDERDTLWNVDARPSPDGAVALSVYHQDADGFSDGGTISASVAPGVWHCVRLDVSPDAPTAGSLSLDGGPRVDIDDVGTPLGVVYEVSIGSLYIGPDGVAPTVSFDEVSVGESAAVTC